MDIVSTLSQSMLRISYIFFYPPNTKTLEYLYKGQHNLIRVFVSHFQYGIHDNDTIGDDWGKVTNDKFNEFYMVYYDTFSLLHKAGIENTVPTSENSPFKPYYVVDKFKISIKINPTLFLVF